MTKSKIRSILALSIILIFMLTSSIIVLYSYANDLEGVVDGKLKIDYLKEYMSIFSGIIGVVIGYYFGTNSKSE